MDVGITPLALQFMELISTREELWRHAYGYSLWHHLCECMFVDKGVGFGLWWSGLQFWVGISVLGFGFSGHRWMSV